MTAVNPHLLLRALFDELARCGMQIAVSAAGSRNTPLIEAIVAEERIRAVSHVDERSAGFFAVGATRAAGRPVAVSVTSGTAGANLLPAVIEASEANLGLIILTADRPSELRQVGAGQTIDQVKLYGPYVRFFAELDLADASAERMRWIRSLACRAYWTAQGPGGGPVHLNVPLREPLVTDAPLGEDPAGGEGRPGGRPWVWSAPLVRAPTWTPPEGRAVIVAGQHADSQIARYAATNAIPLLADPLSGARCGPAAIATYDLILRDPAAARSLEPAVVLRFGDLPTSKPLRRWLAGLQRAEQIVCHPHPVWPDPDATMSQRRIGTGLPGPLPQPPGWLERWRAADASVEAAVIDQLGDPLSEPAVVRALAEVLDAGHDLFVAASMPIRDVEEFFPVRQDPPRILANRGANGIDGTVSSAFGSAAASGRPTVLLIGDVALAHDIGGLLTGRRSGLKLTVVLINNDGGGIFHFLPIASPEHAAAFSEHVATPHGLNFAHAAALYGLDHLVATDVGGFTAALHRALQPDAPSAILEVRTDRAENRTLHADVAAAAAAALGADRQSGPAPTGSRADGSDVS